jgi:hypothetical protein
MSMRQLLSILDQGNTSGCSSYAIAGMANYLLAQAGRVDRVDANQLYLIETGKGGNTVGDILAKAMNDGLPLINGGTIKLKSYQRLPSGAINTINNLKDGLLVFTYQICNGESFDVSAPEYTMPWPLETHSMVLCDINASTQQFYVANSWGLEWGDKGYFFMDYEHMIDPFCVDIYTFTLDI